MKNAQEFVYELDHIISPLLPEKVFFHCMRMTSFAHSLRIRFVDFDHTTSYFHKEYDFSNRDAMVRELIKDTQEFTEIWNSPLMKALR